jgi:Na+/proline symporter
VDPGLVGNDTAYPAMLKFLPAGFLGLMVAGLLAAYRSTIETHRNWGTSCPVHDLDRRFLYSNAPEKHCVLVGRIVYGRTALGTAWLAVFLATGAALARLVPRLRSRAVAPGSAGS